MRNFDLHRFEPGILMFSSTGASTRREAENREAYGDGNERDAEGNMRNVSPHWWDFSVDWYGGVAPLNFQGFQYSVMLASLF